MPANLKSSLVMAIDVSCLYKAILSNEVRPMKKRVSLVTFCDNRYTALNLRSLLRRWGRVVSAASVAGTAAPSYELSVRDNRLLCRIP